LSIGRALEIIFLSNLEPNQLNLLKGSNMKIILATICALFLGITAQAQGLIGDIMNVETVNIELTEENEKLKAEYDETLEKETANLDDDLAKYDETYTDDVTKLIQDFTKSLEDGDEKVVINQKRRVVTRVKSMTMSHKKKKKDAVQLYINAMQIANRKLPDFMRSDADKEVKKTAADHLKTFDEEYIGNLDAVRGFEKKEHLVINSSESVSTN